MPSPLSGCTVVTYGLPCIFTGNEPQNEHEEASKAAKASKDEETLKAKRSESEQTVSKRVAKKEQRWDKKGAVMSKIMRQNEAKKEQK